METKTFNGFNDFLGKFEQKIFEERKILNESNEYFKNQRDKRPYSESIYNNIFDNLDKKEQTMNEHVSKMTEINQNIERIINEIRDFKSLIMEVKLSVNNHNFNTGIQGLLTHTISQDPNADEIIKYLPSPFVDYMNMGYVSTPYNPNASGKKNKKRNTKRKTLKVHKHKFRRN
jgi:hypothetical protein